jgi:thymidylate kinase
MKKRGKFIVIYGANNLGKSTQVDQLVEKLQKRGIRVKKIKYPIYDLEQTGPRINAALREGLPMTDRELQKEFSQNRRDFEPQLVELLKQGWWVVGEDYTGTGVAWGVTHDIPLEEMEKMNEGLLQEDIGILMDGKRFILGKEKGHRHEDGADWEKARSVHQDLAKRYGWKSVKANQSIKKVSGDIWKVVESEFFS